MRTRCMEEGCTRTHNARGLCGRHYRQYIREGRELPARVGNRRGNLITEPWLREHVIYDGTECLIWPFGFEGDGYGQATLGSRGMKAHRAMCILAHGEPPEGANQAAHRCGNRKCVNPKHLYWATEQQNSDDKFPHGSVRRGSHAPCAKLTEAQVLKILRDDRPSKEVAADYACAARSIRAIREGKTWSWLTGRYNEKTRRMRALHEQLPG